MMLILHHAPPGVEPGDSQTRTVSSQHLSTVYFSVYLFRHHNSYFPKISIGTTKPSPNSHAVFSTIRYLQPRITALTRLNVPKTRLLPLCCGYVHLPTRYLKFSVGSTSYLSLLLVSHYWTFNDRNTIAPQKINNLF